jgi:hypothetical protein
MLGNPRISSKLLGMVGLSVLGLPAGVNHAAGRTGAAASPEVLASAHQTSGRAASLGPMPIASSPISARAAQARTMREAARAGLIRARYQRDTG